MAIFKTGGLPVAPTLQAPGSFGFTVLPSGVGSYTALVFGIPTTFALSAVGERYSVQAVLPLWLVAAIGGLILTTAVLSGMFALRALRLVEPAALLR